MSRIPNLGVLERAYPAGPAEPVPSIAGSNLGRTQQDSHPPGALPIGRLAVGRAETGLFESLSLSDLGRVPPTRERALSGPEG